MLRNLQDQVAEWATHNFGNPPSWHSLLGIVEEAGELCHGYLKRAQDIRGTREKHDAEIRDAIGDIVVYLADFCNKENIDFEGVVLDVWSEVKKRDWKENKQTGE